MTAKAEQRKFRRWPYQGLGMLYVVKDPKASEAKPAYIKSRNISGGGILLTGLQPFVPGTVLAMSLATVYKDGKDKLFGRVIRSREVKPGFFETAIAFILLGTPDYEAVGRVMGS